MKQAMLDVQQTNISPGFPGDPKSTSFHTAALPGERPDEWWKEIDSQSLQNPTLPRECRRKPSLPAATNLSLVQDLDVLLLLDEDNFRIGMRKDHGLRIDAQALRRRAADHAHCVHALAAFCFTGSDSRETYFKRCGWDVVAVREQMVHTVDGAVRKANVDMDLCVEAGIRAHSLVTSKQCNCTLIGSGDGDLCVAIARTLKHHFPSHRVLTLSVPGSTSKRLTGEPTLFDGHMEVGLDVALPSRTQA